MMTKELFLQRSQAVKEIDSQDFPGVFIRRLSLIQRLALESEVAGYPDDKLRGLYSMLALIRYAVCDDAGSRLFGDTDDDKTDITKLHYNSDQLRWLAEEISTFNGMAKAEEESAEKNSEAGPNFGS